MESGGLIPFICMQINAHELMHVNLSYCEIKPRIEAGSPLPRPAVVTGVYDSYEDNKHNY